MDILEKLDTYIVSDTIKRKELVKNENDKLTLQLFQKIEKAELRILKRFVYAESN